MTPAELLVFRQEAAAYYGSLMGLAGTLQAAPTESLSQDELADSIAEAVFLRAFSRYESSLESLFFHYVTGGVSITGTPANSYLQPGNDEVARRMVKAGFRFMSWAKPEIIRDTAKVYIENGWPLADMMATRTQELADCERVRNRIAHNSTEARTQFNIVQRNLLGTERLFNVTPGQLLRMRSRNTNNTHVERYLEILGETLDSMTDPPP